MEDRYASRPRAGEQARRLRQRGFDTFQLHDALTVGVLAVDHDERGLPERRRLIAQPHQIPQGGGPCHVIAFFGGCLELTLAARGCPRQAPGLPAGIFAAVIALRGSQAATPTRAGDDRRLYAINRVQDTAAPGMAATYDQREGRNRDQNAHSCAAPRRCCGG